jgi:catechol 2,3-dioxygenase
VLLRLIERRWPLQGLSDHGVSEALYLADADGNGLEIYADRPASEWPRRNGTLSMHTFPLNVSALLATIPDGHGAALPAGTRLGHVHLRVRDLPGAERFYTRELPLEVTVKGFPGALFFAADGYHHHIGANTWGVRSPQPAATHAGLASVVASVRGLEAARVATDPDGNRFELQPA